MILLDTSALIDSLTGPRRSLAILRHILEARERVGICSLVLYEWLRWPRTDEELAAQESLFPAAAAVPFENEDARTSARIYSSLTRSRSREIDIAIAACAIRREAQLWTLNPEDFAGIPGLRLFRAK